MLPSSLPKGRWQKFATALLTLPFLAALTPAGAAPLESLMTGPTPLILKDGRIAHVSVHAIPFDLKKSELDDTTRMAVERLLVPMATDCFLTAQAIGHVQPGDQADGDTLSAHRLARARADRIQQTLINLGLPAKSVASVWDWQFMVKEPRVTLWVFQLHKGEDCEGKPVNDAIVASLDNSVGAKAPQSKEKVEAVAPKAETTPSKVERTEPRPLTSRDEINARETSAKPAVKVSEIRESDVAGPSTPQQPVAVTPTIPVTASRVPVQDLTKPPKVASIESETRPIVPPAQIEVPASLTSMDATPAKAGQEVSEDNAGNTVEAVRPVEQVEQKVVAASPAPAPATAPSQAMASNNRTSITFAMNSSFFGGSGARTLKTFVDSLDKGKTYRIHLSGAVGTDPVSGGGAAEAEKYNRWMAERRVERIAEWLNANSNGRQIEIVRDYIENDPSRTVNIAAGPAS